MKAKSNWWTGIDILLSDFLRDIRILIENKIYAKIRKNQLIRYNNFLQQCLIYIT